MSIRSALCVVLAAVAAAHAAPTARERQFLTYGELTGKAPLARPVSMSAFAPGTALPSNRFEGRLQIRFGAADIEVLRDDYDTAGDADAPWRRLPAFDFAFVQSGTALIPLKRGVIADGGGRWEFILEPGRVWDEPGDRGFSRASIPFALEERDRNCMHNGVLSFLFKADGAISSVAYESGSETCLYAKFDMWGSAPARYMPQKLASGEAAAADYAAEIAHRMATRPIARLAADYPGVDPSRFGAEIDPQDMTTFGVVVNGVIYVGSCNTRFGAYPFCAELDLPSYSLAKSIVAGLASMRMNLLFPGVMDLTVGSLVPECTAGWNDVTLGQMLDMASGHYASSRDQVDELALNASSFFLTNKHSGRITYACTQYPRQARPGTLWVYHTTDMYILGSALRSFYQRKTGPAADFYDDLLVKPIWRTLHLDPALDVTQRSRDAIAQPDTGWGLTLHRDDVAKLARFISVNRGTIDSTPVLDPKMLESALQRDPADRGLFAASPDLHYKNGFWAWNAKEVLGCKRPAWIPFMSGFGGITVALMPNGVAYYYFSDGGKFAWLEAVRQAAKIAPLCSEEAHGQ